MVERKVNVTTALEMILLMACTRKYFACPYMTVGILRIELRLVYITFWLESWHGRMFYDKVRHL